MIRRLLIANRGEIAVRIIRACRELRIESVAVYSDPDAAWPHALLADRAVRIGPAPPRESYLDIHRIIDAARRAGADAIHPGYGFLAERADFAAACEDAGVTFVGPPSSAIAAMGSKIEARRLMAAAGVPIVPGGPPEDQSVDGLATAAAQVGYPVLLKPSAGGGGKGMRVVRSAGELEPAVQGARREAMAAFGDDTLYVERLLERPRHVEIQIFAADDGIVHLFERECSVQRRHQKTIEESPSLALTPALRERMGRAAVAAAAAVEYRNAGTIEFLLEGRGDDSNFYFLEMNTRLQVEHPVTEAVTGVDLVRAQLLVAGGAPLPWKQGDLGQRGHAVECRVYAEDPREFLPQSGTVLLYREPQGPGIRVDTGIAEGVDVTVHYDPLLAKVVTSGETRDAAIARATAALSNFAVLGVETNVAFLLRVLGHDAFRKGNLHTGFIDEHERELLPDEEAPPAAVIAAAAFAETPGMKFAGDRQMQADPDPWATLNGWRL